MVLSLDKCFRINYPSGRLTLLENLVGGVISGLSRHSLIQTSMKSAAGFYPNFSCADKDLMKSLITSEEKGGKTATYFPLHNRCLLYTSDAADE